MFLPKDRLAGAAVRSHSGKARGRSGKGFPVQVDQLVGNFPEEEVEIENALFEDQVPQAQVPLVIDVVQVHLGGAAHLAGDVVYPRQRPGGHAEDPIGPEPLFHHDVYSSGGKHTPQGTAL